MINQLDHIAIAVKNTDEALMFYRDKLGLPVVLSEVMDDSKVRLTHLDLGNLHLQLVEPLTDEHPLQEFLETSGEGLHHLCFYTDDLDETVKEVSQKDLKLRKPEYHSAPLAKQAAFIDPATARGVIWEFTGPKTE